MASPLQALVGHRPSIQTCDLQAHNISEPKLHHWQYLPRSILLWTREGAKGGNVTSYAVDLSFLLNINETAVQNRLLAKDACQNRGKAKAQQY